MGLSSLQDYIFLRNANIRSVCPYDRFTRRGAERLPPPAQTRTQRKKRGWSQLKRPSRPPPLSRDTSVHVFACSCIRLCVLSLAFAFTATGSRQRAHGNTSTAAFTETVTHQRATPNLDPGGGWGGGHMCKTICKGNDICLGLSNLRRHLDTARKHGIRTHEPF